METDVDGSNHTEMKEERRAKKRNEFNIVLRNELTHSVIGTIFVVIGRAK